MDTVFPEPPHEPLSSASEPCYFILVECSRTGQSQKYRGGLCSSITLSVRVPWMWTSSQGAQCKWFVWRWSPEMLDGARGHERREPEEGEPPSQLSRGATGS